MPLSQLASTGFSGGRAMASNFMLVLLLLICIGTAQMKGVVASPNRSGSLLFLDNPHHGFLRRGIASSSHSQEFYWTQSDVAATISVLLGFAPSASLTPLSSSKLDMLLTPSPFDRPNAVFMLEAKGINQDLWSGLDYSIIGLESYNHRHLLAESTRTSIEIPENEVWFNSFNEDDKCDVHCIEKDLEVLAVWLGGSYSEGRQPLEGNLSVPLSKDSVLTLNLVKRADQTFVKELVSLHRNIRRVASMHRDLMESSCKKAHLLLGSFAGVEVLQKYYVQNNIPRKGLELFLIVVARHFYSLQSSYNGQILGVIAINRDSVPESEGIFNVKLSSRNSRWLSDIEASTMPNSTITEVQVVRRAAAWSTAVILLIAILAGVLYLFNMPLNRDTLLYSSVKLD